MDLLNGILTGQLMEILDRLADPLFIIDHQRLVLFQNTAAGRILSDGSGLAIRQGRLHLTTSVEDSRLDEIVHACHYAEDGKYQQGRGLKLLGHSESKEWLAGVSALKPIPELSNEPIFLVHLVDRLHARPLPSAALHDLFGLTDKETVVLEGLMRNESLRRIGAGMSLSHETIRCYLKRIFRKCEVHSRIELLVLIQRISLLSR